MQNKFKITGKAMYVSKEEVRAMLHAIDVVLCYHNAGDQTLPIMVKIRHDLKLSGKKVDGLCCGRNVYLDADLKSPSMLTTIIHEMIHVYFYWENGLEKITSTLTARMKADVARIANVLVENTYRRAGYIAHTKISYRLKGRRKDYYDSEEEHLNHEDSNGKKYRIRKGGDAGESKMQEM